MALGVEFVSITKSFPGVVALDGVSFQANAGEIVALVGENGAGKSTLLKILNGDYQPDSGHYLIDGEEKHFKTPHEAIVAGVGVIYQERQVVPYLTVAENVFMEDIPKTTYGLIDFGRLNRRSQEIIDEFKLPIKPTQKVKDLSMPFQQMVEIMKAYRRGPKIIAFDEPTASLSDSEIEALFEIIGKLKEKGIVILYVSHRMKEIFEITDQVVILKDGKFVHQSKISNITEIEIVRKMVGRDLGDVFDNLNRNDSIGRTVLKVESVVADNVHNVSFELRAGEILGFAGLVGAGRSEVMRAIFGADKASGGNVWLNDERIKISRPEDAISRGLALCPEDRKEQGIVAFRSIKDNINMAIFNKLTKFGFFDTKKESETAEKGVLDLNVRTPSIYKHIGELSGGNQQKVIVARWLATNPKVLILDEPTKGIDVGSKAELYQIVCDLAMRGIGVILISSELSEVLGLCDRIIVMCQGKIAGELSREEATDEKVLLLAMKDMLGGASESSEAAHLEVEF